MLDEIEAAMYSVALTILQVRLAGGRAWAGAELT